MRTSVQKWGNSLALRIPRPLAEELGIKPGSPVNITTEQGHIVISPATLQYTLDDLLKGITPARLHRETDTGDRVVNEVW